MNITEENVFWACEVCDSTYMVKPERCTFCEDENLMPHLLRDYEEETK